MNPKLHYQISYNIRASEKISSHGEEQCKNKIYFVDRTLHKPISHSSRYSASTKCNSMLIQWILTRTLLILDEVMKRLPMKIKLSMCCDARPRHVHLDMRLVFLSHYTQKISFLWNERLFNAKVNKYRREVRKIYNMKAYARGCYMALLRVCACRGFTNKNIKIVYVCGRYATPILTPLNSKKCIEVCVLETSYQAGIFERCGQDRATWVVQTFSMTEEHGLLDLWLMTGQHWLLYLWPVTE